jgi:hypothetical protein
VRREIKILRLFMHPHIIRLYEVPGNPQGLVPSLIEGLRVVQGLRVVPVFLYRYSMKN